MSETKAAWNKLIRNLRIYLCEEFMIWGLRIKPDDYVPMIVGVAVSNGFKRGISDLEAALSRQESTGS